MPTTEPSGAGQSVIECPSARVVTNFLGLNISQLKQHTMKLVSANATANIVFAIILLAHTAAANAAEVKPPSVVPPGWVFNAPALKSYADVQALLNEFMIKNNGSIEFSPHGAFWNEMSYKQFIGGNLPEVTDPATGKPLKILMVGNARESNIIKALRGAKGSIFDRDTGSIGRMPPTGPFMSDQEINRLADWIERGCPDGL